jgi:hypothetical protein
MWGYLHAAVHTASTRTPAPAAIFTDVEGARVEVPSEFSGLPASPSLSTLQKPLASGSIARGGTGSDSGPLAATGLVAELPSNLARGLSGRRDLGPRMGGTLSTQSTHSTLTTRASISTLQCSPSKRWVGTLEPRLASSCTRGSLIERRLIKPSPRQNHNVGLPRRLNMNCCENQFFWCTPGH